MYSIKNYCGEEKNRVVPGAFISERMNLKMGILKPCGTFRGRLIAYIVPILDVFFFYCLDKSRIFFGCFVASGTVSVSSAREAF